MSNPDRLTGLDASFLHLERDSAHMHVGSCLVFEGDPPSYDDMLRHIEERLHLVPRYRQRLAFVPLQQGRPVWVDDPHFNVSYHVRHNALPKPGSEEQLRNLAGRAFAQGLDRSKPLWEIWLVSGLRGNRFGVVTKTHHALVDGVSGVDLATVLFDTAAEPEPIPPPETPWMPRPMPSGAQLLADALIERATVPGEAVRGARALLRTPRKVLGSVRDALGAVGGLAWTGFSDAAPDTPLNVPIGPHRRFAWVEADLVRFKAIKDSLGGTVNDVVLTAVSIALGRFLRERGHPTEGLVLKAMVPVSVRAEIERGALGNRVATMYAPLPVGESDPATAFGSIHAAMADLKESSQAVGAEVLTDLAGFAPPTIMAQAARLQSRQRFFNLVVTNIPGPQFPLYLLGRRLQAMYPQVPLAQNQGVGIAIMSYDGVLFFGLLADYDALPDLESLTEHLEEAVEVLAAAAGVGGERRTAGNGKPPLGIPMPSGRPGGRKRKPAGRATS